MRKIVYGMLIVMIIIIGIIVALKIKVNNNVMNSSFQDQGIENDRVEEYYNEIIKLSNRIKKNATRSEKEIIYNYYANEKKALTDMCKKDGNWELIPIDDDTYNQYNEKDGILGNIEFDSIECLNEEDSGIGMAQVVTTKGKEKIRYLIDYSLGSLIHHIKIFQVTPLTDKDGNELDARDRFIDQQVIYNFNSLCYDGILWDDDEVAGSDVATTDSFRKKYPIFLDLFTHYSPLEYNPITFDERKSKLNNHMAYFIVTSVLECKEREYELYYQLDENYYLDDAYAVCVKERELEPDNKNSGTKAFYKNSNLNYTNLSEEFKQRIKENGSYNKDIDNIDINYFSDELCLDEGVYTKFIRCYKMKDNSIYSYYVEYIFDNNIINDIISKKLPYQNMSAKEVKELYLKEKSGID